MKTEYFTYTLPKELIAQEPTAKRQDARLMVLDRRSGKIKHRKFYELPAYLKQGDLLAINDTKVIQARLIGTREILLIKQLKSGQWEVLIKPQRGLKIGGEITFDGNPVTAKVNSRTGDGTYIIKFSKDQQIFDAGYAPLPPYIKRDYTNPSSLHQLDRIRYQTVYAKNPGAIAAPTAGMHFTEELLEKIKDQGITVAPLTLHVGWGTFRPVRAEYVANHRMLPEWFSIPNTTASAIKKAKRIIAVGTTTVRALETGATSGYTDLFIYPPYKFKVVDALITNFHLPKSTLIMLVSAFAGKDLLMEAYQEAIRQKYRFYSYGDAMLIL